MRELRTKKSRMSLHYAPKFLFSLAAKRVPRRVARNECTGSYVWSAVRLECSGAPLAEVWWCSKATSTVRAQDLPYNIHTKERK